MNDECTSYTSLVEARKAAKISQQELSRRTGVTQGDISKYECHKGNPTIKMLTLFADAMDMDLEVIFKKRENKH